MEQLLKATSMVDCVAIGMGGGSYQDESGAWHEFGTGPGNVRRGITPGMTAREFVDAFHPELADRLS